MVMLFGTIFTANMKVNINVSLFLPLQEFTSYAPLVTFKEKTNAQITVFLTISFEC